MSGTSKLTHADWRGGKLLTVRGKDFLCSAYIKQDTTGWYVVDIAPYLAKIVQNIPIERWGQKFKSIGARYEWKSDDEIENGYDFDQRVRQRQEEQQELFDDE